MKRLGFIEDQAAFILYSFRIDEAERAAWKLASINSKASLIYLAHLLKFSAVSKPFLQIPNWGLKLKMRREEFAAQLNLEALEALGMLEEALERVEGGFHEKIVFLLKETLKVYLLKLSSAVKV